MPEPTHDPELAALQAALTRLTPAPDGINVARLLFRAGQASVPRCGWAWPCATAASALLAASLGAVLLLRPGPQTIERVVTVYKEPPTQPPGASAGTTQAQSASAGNRPAEPAYADSRPEDGDYVRLRREVLAHGVDALPPLAPWPAADRPSDADTPFSLPPGDTPEPWLHRLKNSLRSGDAS